MFSLSRYWTVTGCRMPSFSMEAWSSHCALSSNALRGWWGSGRTRSISMRNAPVRRCRPSRALAFARVSWSTGNLDEWLKVLAAAASAEARDPLGAALHFIEELPGDAGGDASAGVEGDGDAVGNTLLECCQIGQDRVKSLRPEMFAQLS